MRGTVVTAWRKELGWSQERLADELGVDRQLVEELERSNNITPLIEGLLGTIRSALTAMRRPAAAAPEIVAKGRVVNGVVRAPRRV